MTKKFLAVTLVLVLAAGFMAVAAEHEDERPLMGSWENELTLDPDATPNVIDAFSSTLTVEYMTGGITYESVSEFDIDGYTDQTFNVDATVGLLDLSSTVNFDTQTPGLDYWKNTASLTLGGVSITDTFLLQKTSSYGAGMDLAFSGETPGGVSVNVSNYFGMEPDSSAASGYAIVTKHHPDDELDSYGASSLQYVSSVLTLDNLSLGCCDFSNETMFSEANGFEYSLFEFTIESNDWPLSLAADLKFTAQTKSIYLTPSLTTDWSCFEVYTDLSGVLGNNSPEMSGSTIDGLEVAGFAIKDVELGHVEFSSYTALGGHTLYDLYLNFGSDTPYIVGTTYDE
ncbi:MAG: hypothetical protein V5A81_07170, partial [Candidatus Bipolaricaulota bacterium]